MRQVEESLRRNSLAARVSGGRRRLLADRFKRRSALLDTGTGS